METLLFLIGLNPRKVKVFWGFGWVFC